MPQRATFVKSASFAMCSTSSSLFIWPLLASFDVCDAARVPPPSVRSRLAARRIDARGEPLLANWPRESRLSGRQTHNIVGLPGIRGLKREEPRIRRIRGPILRQLCCRVGDQCATIPRLRRRRRRRRRLLAVSSRRSAAAGAPAHGQGLLHARNRHDSSRSSRVRQVDEILGVVLGMRTFLIRRAKPRAAFPLARRSADARAVTSPVIATSWRTQCGQHRDDDRRHRHAGRSRPSASRPPARGRGRRACRTTSARCEVDRARAHVRAQPRSTPSSRLEVAGHGHAPCRHHHAFDRQQLAADFGPREPGDQPTWSSLDSPKRNFGGPR